MNATLPRRLLAEGLGSALLLAVVVGSGIMAESLSGGNTGLALLANALATGAGLYALILTFGPVSGAHFNPAVSLFEALRGRMAWSHAAAYAGMQAIGAVLGVWLAHAMFARPLWQLSAHVRTGGAQWLAETVATAGLLLVIASTTRHRRDSTPAAVATYITAAYWFTASTAFANPAVTLARALTDSFAGIRPQDAPGFVLAQLGGVLVAAAVARVLFDDRPGGMRLSG